ncbi:unnamed protein product [Allacma fusca]|uniref:Uncharacterized protein n=1 Tax=Allacma fusca TaxID=39272 RepID=A0A8J2PWA6_9HEXA|nr:unnamed protein product [Allacma fusca]
MGGCFGKKKSKNKKTNWDQSQDDHHTYQQNFSTEYQISSRSPQKSVHQKHGHGIKSNTKSDNQTQTTDLNFNVPQAHTPKNIPRTERQLEPSSPEVRHGKTPKTSKTQTLVNIGIYLDESHISIGTTDPEKIQPKLLLQHPGQLTLLQDRTEIGKNINSTEIKYSFNLYDLLKDEANSVYEVAFEKVAFSVSPEELLVLFFKNLRAQIKVNLKDASVGNAIVSTAFLLTSFEKQRLKFAMTSASIVPTRIVTSLLTTAIAEATYNRCLTRSKIDHEYVVVVHSVTNSFSMAIIEVGKDYIFMRRCTGSENYELPFNKKNAITLYEHGLSDLHIEDYGCDKILEVSKLEPVPLVGKTSYGGTMNVSSVAAFLGPFAGACFLACSAFMPQLKLPSNINVQDASRSDLAVHLDSWVNPRQISFKNTSIIRRTIFQDKVSVPAEGIQMTLFEQYGDSVIQVGQFRIDRPEWSNEAFLQVLVNQDGMFNVTSKDANVMRLSEFAGKTRGQQMQDTKILEYYSSPSKGVPNKNKLNDLPNLPNRIQNASGKVNRGNSKIPQSKSAHMESGSSLTTMLSKDVMTKAVEVGLQHHQEVMHQITDQGEPFSVRQINHYHEKSKTEALQAFEESFGCLQQNAPVAFSSAKTNFEARINSQLPTYIMRHEVKIEKVAKEKHLLNYNSQLGLEK